MKIQIIKEIHYIEGNKYTAYLYTDNFDIKTGAGQMYLGKVDDLLRMTGAINCIQSMLQILGNKVEVDIKEYPDPNFETQEDANNHFDNK